MKTYLYKLSIPDELTRVQRRSYVRLDITMPVKYAEVAKELESLLEENGWEGILQDSSIPWETGTIMDISRGRHKPCSQPAFGGRRPGLCIYQVRRAGNRD